MPGYDIARKTREKDDFGRWRFAAEIADAVRFDPPDWSAWIGILGQMGRPGELDELWAEFGDQILSWRR